MSNPFDSSPRSVTPATEVTFQGNNVVKTLTVDNKGFYEADLPVGLYTMTAEVPKMGYHLYYLTKYVRQFRVISPTTIILNGTLYKARMTCDIVISPEDITREQQREVSKDACGDEDSFSAPSKEGVPFQLYVRYPHRELTGRGYVYSIDDPTQPGVPVFVAYNLFSLEADKVIYDLKNRTIEARGNVVVDNASGTTRRADSMTLKIESGQAHQIR